MWITNPPSTSREEKKEMFLLIDLELTHYCAVSKSHFICSANAARSAIHRA
jgi:hypothetical protein